MLRSAKSITISKKYTYNCAWDFSHQEVPPQLLRNNISMQKCNNITLQSGFANKAGSLGAWLDWLIVYSLTVFALIVPLLPINKVNRCLARYSPRATSTNRPTTGHWISLHGLAQIDQKCQFWAKFGRFGAKNPNFYWKNQKICYPHNGKPT